MANLTDDQLSDLERLANAAIRGPWEHRRNDQAIKLGIAGTIWSASGVFLSEIAGRWVDTADFIATAHPQTVKALIADLREAKSNLREARESLAATERELERWRHGVTIEGDFVCPDSLQLAEARRLLDAALPLKGGSDG